MSCLRNSSRENFDVYSNNSQSWKSYATTSWPEPRSCFDLSLNRKWIKDGPLGKIYPALTVKHSDSIPIYNEQSCKKIKIGHNNTL